MHVHGNYTLFCLNYTIINTVEEQHMGQATDSTSAILGSAGRTMYHTQWRHQGGHGVGVADELNSTISAVWRGKHHGYRSDAGKREAQDEGRLYPTIKQPSGTLVQALFLSSSSSVVMHAF